MEQAMLQIEYYQGTDIAVGPETLAARIQDATLATRKKLVLKPTETSTSSGTAAFASVAGVVLITASSVTAGVGDFLSQQLTEVNVGVENAVKRWDIRPLLDPKIMEDLVTQQSSSYTGTSTTTSDLISFVRNHVQLPYSADLAKRLEYLRVASIEEYPEQAPMSIDSLQCFLSFVKREPNLTEPDLVLTYAGNIRAEWHKSRKEHFAVEFLPNGQVHYVVFTRDPDHPTRTDRTSGLVSAATLMQKVKPFDVLSWAAT